MTKPSRVVEGSQYDFSEVANSRLFGGALADAQSMRVPVPLNRDPPREQIQEAKARAAAMDDDGEEETTSEASSVPPLTPDDSDVDDAYPALPEEAKGALQEKEHSEMLWLLDEDVAASMMLSWINMTPQQVEDEVAEMDGLMVPVAQIHGGLVRLLKSRPDRPAEAGLPLRGKHMGPRASRAAMVWVQVVRQSRQLLHGVAETLGTTYWELKSKLIRTTMACDNYAGMRRLLQPALQNNRPLVVEYRALQLLFKATVEAVQGASGIVEATLNMASEQLINTVADLMGQPREMVATRAAEPNLYARYITAVWWLCRETGYLDYDTQTARGCYRSVS